jgi:hypothetical protein
MKPILKRIFGAVTLVGALASVVAGRERPTLELAAPQARAPIASRVEDLDLDALAARSEEMPVDEASRKVDPFAPRSFSAPAAADAPKAPQKPVAPPLPFRYLGKMLEDGRLAVFLAHGEESLSVSAGQRIGDYRVDKVTESEVVFTYLPLKTKQTLPL